MRATKKHKQPTEELKIISDQEKLREINTAIAELELKLIPRARLTDNQLAKELTIKKDELFALKRKYQ